MGMFFLSAITLLEKYVGLAINSFINYQSSFSQLETHLNVPARKVENYAGIKQCNIVILIHALFPYRPISRQLPSAAVSVSFLQSATA